MNSILRISLISIFVVCLSSIYVGNALSASDGGCCGGGHSDKKSMEDTEVVKDPVCGMEFSELKKELSAEYKSNVYYFCSEYCKNTFKTDPASYTPMVSLQHSEGGGHQH